MFHKALKNMMVHDSLHCMLKGVLRCPVFKIVPDNIGFFIFHIF